MERSEDYMAKRFSEVKRELEQPDGHMAGIGQQLKLSEEARDARNAGRRLEDENDETDLIGTVKKLEDLIAEQRRSNERIAREMRGMVSEMKDVLEKVEELRNGAADSEEQLHRQAAEAFANAGLEAAHEVSLAPRCRIDFMVGDIGVEIKKKRPQRAPLVAQLTRYANCPQIARLIVLAPRGVDLPKSIGGKPVMMMSLEKLWGIMLP